MNRYQLLAAEIYGYSYDNYEDHLGINIRYDKLMPKDVKCLERAVQEDWPLERIARELDRDTDEAAALREAFCAARDVVDARTPAESFRRAVRQVIKRAIAKGLNDDKSIEKLVVQICYRAADLGFLLKRADEPLSKYSQDLRVEPDDLSLDDDD